MIESIRDMQAKIKELEQCINVLTREIEEKANVPQTFDVTLRVTSRPSTWNESELDRMEIEEHFLQHLTDMRDALCFDDEGDEIKVIDVKEVSSDNA
jgi:hypothetical protein